MVVSKESKILWTKIVLVFVFSLLIAFILSPMGLRDIHADISGIIHHQGIKNIVASYIREIPIQSGQYVRWDYFQILTVLMAFLLSHFIVEPYRIRNFIFKYRWLIGLLLLVYLVVNGYNGDSLGAYDMMGVQPGQGSAYVYPIFGKLRTIRSDEFIVYDPSALFSMMSGHYTEGVGLITILTNPLAAVNVIVFKLGGPAASFSLSYFAYKIIGFLVSIDFFMLLTRGKRGISIAATSMYYFSGYYLWWGFPAYVMYSQGAILCFDRFYETEKTWKKILYLYFSAWFIYSFVTNLYPAWEVPMAWVSVVLAIWVINKNWDKIRNMSAKERIVFYSVIVLMIAGMILFVISKLDYIQTIMKTVYPGQRIDLGGNVLEKAFSYIPGVLFAYKDFAYPNPCEAASVVSLFPIPMVLGVIYFFKTKKDKILIIGLEVVSIVFLFYCSTGLPKPIAVATLLSHSTASRCVDILGYVNILLFAIVMSRKQEEVAEKKNYAVIPRYVAGIVLGIGAALLCMYYAKKMSYDYLSTKMVILLFLMFAAIYILMIIPYKAVWMKSMLILVTIVCVVTGIYIRPLNRGLDSIYSKPVAKEIQRIVKEDPDKEWMSYNSIVLSSYSTMCGAKTWDFVNTTPNMDLWHKLDPQNRYEDIYNRYEHIAVDFVESDTSFELVQDDFIRIHLNIKDLKKTNTSYLFSQQQLNGNSEFDLKQLYSEGGVYIYKVEYNEK